MKNVPAFPFAWHDVSQYQYTEAGLTKRELFAALILQGMSSIPDSLTSRKMGVSMAVEIADELIKELAKEPEE